MRLAALALLLLPLAAAARVPGPHPEHLATTLHVGAAGFSGEGTLGLALAIEGGRPGFRASVDAFAPEEAGGGPLDGVRPLGWASAHATWAPVAARRVRVRLEAGGSLLSLPQAGPGVDPPWAGRVVLGANLGISGEWSIWGPVALEGHARLTPGAVPVTDARLALAARVGPLALTGGWRALDVRGDGEDAPDVRFDGPEVGLAFRF